jgi:hypothetical protein
MSISKKILLVSFAVLAMGSMVSASHFYPSETTEILIQRNPTTNEIALADAKAALVLSNLGKPDLQMFGEALDKNMTYLYNAQPFGIQHGFVKGAGIVATAGVIVYLCKLYYAADDSKNDKNH